MKTDRRLLPPALCILAVVSVAPAAAQSGDYDEAYTEYLSSARTPSGAVAPWMGDLMSDPTARRINDLVTIDVVESVIAAGSADSQLSKGSNANVSMPDPIAEYLGKFLPITSDTGFTGSGGTSRSTNLLATITARVVEVLPSGDLVVEGIREIGINGDRLVVVLSGVIRPVDIQPGNVVPSTRVGQLRIQSVSQGLIKDNLAPGWIVRILNKVF